MLPPASRPRQPGAVHPVMRPTLRLGVAHAGWFAHARPHNSETAPPARSATALTTSRRRRTRTARQARLARARQHGEVRPAWSPTRCTGRAARRRSSTRRRPRRSSRRCRAVGPEVLAVTSSSTSGRSRLHRCEPSCSRSSRPCSIRLTMRRAVSLRPARETEPGIDGSAECHAAVRRTVGLGELRRDAPSTRPRSETRSRRDRSTAFSRSSTAPTVAAIRRSDCSTVVLGRRSPGRRPGGRRPRAAAPSARPRRVVPAAPNRFSSPATSERRSTSAAGGPRGAAGEEAGRGPERVLVAPAGRSRGAPVRLGPAHVLVVDRELGRVERLRDRRPGQRRPRRAGRTAQPGDHLGVGRRRRAAGPRAGASRRERAAAARGLQRRSPSSASGRRSRTTRCAARWAVSQPAQQVGASGPSSASRSASSRRSRSASDGEEEVIAEGYRGGARRTPSATSA